VKIALLGTMWIVTLKRNDSGMVEVKRSQSLFLEKGGFFISFFQGLQDVRQ